nr:unnamed protein product [Digitaria exilis]
MRTSRWRNRLTCTTPTTATLGSLKIRGSLPLRLRAQPRRRANRVAEKESSDESITTVPDKEETLCKQGDHPQGGESSTDSRPNLPERINTPMVADKFLHVKHLNVFLRDDDDGASCYPDLRLFVLGFISESCPVLKSFILSVDQHDMQHDSVFGDASPHLGPISVHKHDSLTLDCIFGAEAIGYSVRCATGQYVGFDCLRSLTKLHLSEVCITGDELGNLFSNSFALEELELRWCVELICLKIPFWLKRFSYLRVSECYKLQVIENTAPNLSTVAFFGDPVQLMLRESSQVKNLKVAYSFEPNAVNYAITKLPSIAPHLETLTIYSTCERVNAPIVADKFLHLKHLDIYMGDDDDEAANHIYDYLSLISFLYASPSLESFILSVDLDDMKHDVVFGDASTIRQVPRHRHDKLKKVQVAAECWSRARRGDEAGAERGHSWMQLQQHCQWALAYGTGLLSLPVGLDLELVLVAITAKRRADSHSASAIYSEPAAACTALLPI